MSKPKMSVSVSMIIILTLHRNWCSGRTKHLLVNVLDSQDKFPPLSENGSEERGQDYQDDDYYSNEFQPDYDSRSPEIDYDSSCESCEIFNQALSGIAPPAYSGSVESIEPLAAQPHTCGKCIIGATVGRFICSECSRGNNSDRQYSCRTCTTGTTDAAPFTCSQCTNNNPDITSSDCAPRSMSEETHSMK